MKVMKQLKHGKKCIKVIWRGKEYKLDYHLSRSMTGTTEETMDGICTASGCKSLAFQLHQCRERLEFDPVDDWWELSPREIGETLIKRAKAVRQWVKQQNFIEEAIFDVPFENEEYEEITEDC